MLAFFSNEHGLRQPRLKNYVLHTLHKLGLRRWREGVVPLLDGLSIGVRENTHDRLIVREIWEDQIYPLGDLQFGPDDVVLDIGAQIGSFSLLAASRGARVIAFEPCPMNLFMLRANVKRNGLEDRIEVRPMAVSSPGTEQLRLYQTYTNLGGHSSYGWIGPPVDVDCTSLDVVLREVRGVRVIKVDAEGAEAAIFFGAGAKALENVERAFAEVIDHPAITKWQKEGEPMPDHEGMMAFFENAGFEVARDPETKVVVGTRDQGS